MLAKREIRVFSASGWQQQPETQLKEITSTKISESETFVPESEFGLSL